MVKESTTCLKSEQPKHSNPMTMSKKSVSFNQIHIREYVMDLGDNPSCSNGPPLSLTWEYVELGSVDLRKFEEMRPVRRALDQLIIPMYVRERMLLKSGYSELEIRDAVDSVNVCKMQRAKSANPLSIKLDNILFRANRKLKSRLRLCSKSPSCA